MSKRRKKQPPPPPTAGERFADALGFMLGLAIGIPLLAGQIALRIAWRLLLVAVCLAAGCFLIVFAILRGAYLQEA
jgi:hypothetical protein